MIDNSLIDKLQNCHKNVKIAYGGDGTLAGVWREVYAKKMPIWPIRNYGMCDQHQKMLAALINDDKASFKDMQFKMSIHQLAESNATVSGERQLALNEIQVKNRNITEALRFDVYVNGKKFYENVIADGILFATPNGATGYWKSITRTMFRDGCGLAFISPTVGISSLVLKATDSIKLKLVRDADIVMSHDKIVEDKYFDAGSEFDFRMSAENISIVGYEHFMCFDCRKNRNSTILQDQYIV